MTDRPPEPRPHAAPPQPPGPGYPHPPASGYPQPTAPGYSQPPVSGYPPAPGSGYPQPGAAEYPGPTYPQQTPPAAGSGYPQQQPNLPAGSGDPQHLWPAHAQPPVAAVPAGAQRPTGSAALGVLALFLGLAGLVAPFLPFSNLIDRFPIRQYLAFPFAVPALALALAALAGNRRGKPAAAIGLILAVLALAVGAIMVYNYDFRP